MQWPFVLSLNESVDALSTRKKPQVCLLDACFGGASTTISRYSDRACMLSGLRTRAVASCIDAKNRLIRSPGKLNSPTTFNNQAFIVPSGFEPCVSFNCPNTCQFVLGTWRRGRSTRFTGITIVVMFLLRTISFFHLSNPTVVISVSDTLRDLIDACWR